MSILITIQSVIDKNLAFLKKERSNKKSELFAMFSGNIILSVKSFVEEWDFLGARCASDSRVIEMRRIAAPFIRRIGQWRDLSVVRNIFIAHNLRDKKNSNALLKTYESEINIPTTYGDYVLLAGCVFCIRQILVSSFLEDYNELVSRLNTIKPPQTCKGINGGRLAMNELYLIIAESERLKSLN